MEMPVGYLNLGGFVAILIFLWKLHTDILRLSDRMGGLEQRIARIEGWIEGRFNEVKS